MSLLVYQVDAFTSELFAGNPAAVCVHEASLSDVQQQQIAREMNCSETAFLTRQDDTAFDLRWFTPTDEVDLCGHATLASAHVLWSEDYAPSGSTLTFRTRSGPLTATSGSGGRIELDFPAEPPSDTHPPSGLLAALDVAVVGVYRTPRDLLVEVADETTVRTLAPDMRRLAAIDTRGVIVTAASEDPEVHFVSRFFGPRVGVPEDPVTGSAHCALGPFWMDRLAINPLVGRQVSRRGGTVHVRVDGDRVHLGGHAVMVLSGTLHLDGS
jgi:PhzF family phenazine biosynthesis protein